MSANIVSATMNDYWKLLEIIKSNWRWLVGFAVMGLLAAIGFVLIVPAKYEARALFKSAIIGSTVSGGSVEVEPVSVTLERLSLPSFYTKELVEICGVKDLVYPEQTLVSQFKFKLVKSTSLIRLSYRHESSAVAGACLTAVTEKLKASQNLISAPILTEMKELEVLMKKNLNEARRYQEEIEKQVLNINTSNSNSSVAPFLLQAISSTRIDIDKLQQRYSNHRLLLSEPFTQSGSVLDYVFVEDNMAFRRNALIMAGGLIGGFIFGGLLLLVMLSFGRKACK